MDKLLVIDDSVFIGNVIKSNLSKNVDVYYADSPKKGLLMAQEIVPDIILLDIMMPEIDGFGINKMIKGDPKLKDIPVLFMTSNTDDKVIEKCFNDGAEDYIKKPFNNVELKHRVLMHIRNYKTDKELSVAMQRLHKIAHIDILTDLYNRRYFLEHLTELKKDNDITIVLSDIDNFKQINDTYGHDGGDYVLKKVSYILKTNIKEPNIVARWGGEEFIACIKNMSTEDTMQLIEKIRERMEAEYYKFNDVQFKVTSSFGICKVGNLTISKAMQLADKALYKSKMNGKNMCVLWENED